MASVVMEALELAKAGDSAGAIAMLRAAQDAGPLDEPCTSLLFTLLGDRGDHFDDSDDQLALCEHGLSLARRPLAQSTWHLRRGLLLLAKNDGAGALKDLQRVLSLKASDDHTERARSSLLQVAAMMGSQKKR
jgi:predicted neuraminidase